MRMPTYDAMYLIYLEVKYFDSFMKSSFNRTPVSGNDQSCIEINVVTFCLQFCCQLSVA